MLGPLDRVKHLDICVRPDWSWNTSRTSVRPAWPRLHHTDYPRPAVALTRTMRKDFAPFLEQYKEDAGQYMDDWWIATIDDAEGRALHEKAIHAFLSTCEEKSYFLKASKCEIMRPQITLLGWLVTGEGLRIDPSKVTGISEWPRTLMSVRQVRKTMGVLGYQRPFIPGFAAIAKPIIELTKKGTPFEWTEEQRQAPETLIQK